MSYDRSDWHYESTDPSFPEEERWKRAGAHIAIFLRWLAEHDMLAAEEPDRAQLDDILAVKNGTMAGIVYFEKHMNCKFWECDVSGVGRPFVDAYYGDKGLYLNDVGEFLGDRTFEICESEIDLTAFRKIVDERYKQFLAGGPAAVQKSKTDNDE